MKYLMIVTKYPNKRERNGILNISKEAIIYKNAALIDTDVSLEFLLSFGIFYDGIEISDEEYNSKIELSSYILYPYNLIKDPTFMLIGGRYRMPIFIKINAETESKINRIYETYNRLHTDEPRTMAEVNG